MRRRREGGEAFAEVFWNRLTVEVVMRIFDKPNSTVKWECPICGNDDEKEVALVSVEGTQQGRVVQARQVHVECLALWYYPEQSLIIQDVTRSRDFVQHMKM